MIKTTLNKSKTAIKKQFLKASQVYYNIAGNEVECNICHYKTNKLSSNMWHLYATCPNCGSGVRNRLLFAAFSYLDDFSDKKLIAGKNILHFAPEQATTKQLRKLAKNYKTADYLAKGYHYGDIDYNIDITNMKVIGDKSVDCLIACDVLEHVYDLKNGLSEIYRVIADGGYCILEVPQKDHLAITQEDLTISDPKEREKVFGQDDHMRIFGDDFVSMLEDQGFEVTAVDESFFDKGMVKKHVLAPPVLSKHPMATNYRKVFFGKKVEAAYC